MTVSPEDFIEISDLCYRYAAGVDGRDWALYRSIFGDRVVVDFSSFNRQPAEELATDDWVAMVKPLFTALAASQHSMTNPRVTVDGDDGVITMYLQAEHVLDADDPTSWFTVGGFYTNLARRIDGRWFLSSVTLTITWRRGRPDIMATAAQMGRREHDQQRP